MPVNPIIRFQDLMARLPDDDSCVEWTGCCFTSGYGKFGRSGYAHRRAWELTNGPIPKRMQVCHRCDNPPCVRPDHLFLGSAKANYDDMVQKGRRVIVNPEGDEHGRSKVTREIVRAMRSKYQTGYDGGATKAALEFGISKSAASAILNRKTWRHVL